MTNKILAEIHKNKFDGIDMIATGVTTWIKGRKYFLGIALSTVLLQYLYKYFIFYVLGISENLETIIKTGNIPELSTNQRILFGVITLLMIIFSMIIFTLVIITAKQVIGQNKLPERNDILKETKENRFGLTTTYFLCTLFAIVLTIAGIIPGIIFSVYRIFAYVTVCFHPKIKNMQALKYSKSLIQKKRRKTFGKLLVFGITRGLTIMFLITVLTFFFKLVNIIPNNIGEIIIQTVVTVTSGISYIAIVALFMNYEYQHNKDLFIEFFLLLLPIILRRIKMFRERNPMR